MLIGLSNRMVPWKGSLLAKVAVFWCGAEILRFAQNDRRGAEQQPCVGVMRFFVRRK